MKRSLGRIHHHRLDRGIILIVKNTGFSITLGVTKLVLFLLILAHPLWAATYQWRILEAPKELYVNQSGVVRYECAFTTNAADYTIAFKPTGNENFKVSMLTQRDRIVEGKRVQTFDLLITPLRAGTIEIALDALIRHTTFASIENASIGRDNVKKYDFEDETAQLPKAIILAKANSTALSGEITMEVKVDKRRVIAHEPVHASLYIRGSGNLDQFVPYELNISGVNIFAEQPQKNISPSSAGFEGEIRQEFALVSEKNFVIPSVELEIFDTATQSRKVLRSQAVSIEVVQGFERSNLLDPPQITDWSGWVRYGLYGALIVLGIALDEAIRWLWKRRPRRRTKRFYDGAKTVKELITLLALSGEKRYIEVIEWLENKTVSLSEAKTKLEKIG
ncbi:BatD family protein [Sulfuricurvum sp.]|uniref:BatD family protein n=1 Tax=Sulfuricurvum sp. TaxID=2025608 RepID=UPI001997C1DE|nr:BatD family protein [Sulfuricurvum sp.]MBD3798941.1 BatD family protein [Campylobacterota bacterium]MBD3806751.1 BatD family protein [Sulfuricurvum sp.]